MLNRSKKRLFRGSLVALLAATMLLASLAQAACRSTEFAPLAQGAAAINLAFGRVNLAASSLQPPSSLLASSTATAADFHYGGADAGSVLWRCDKADVERAEVYFLAATNGASRLGGHHPAGVADGLTDVYATWFAHVGLRLEMDGKSLNRRWQRIELKSWQDEGAQIAIRVQDLPSLQAQLYRVSDDLPTEGGSDDCPQGGALTASGVAYRCTAASAFLQLAASGLAHDSVGEDSATHHQGALQGMAYRLSPTLTVSRLPSCVVRSATPAVLLPTASVAQMESDGSAPEAPFSVQLECEQSDAGAQARVGLQVSPGALAAAQRLRLINAQGGVSHLLADDYASNPQMAKGVGIGLFDASGRRLWWVGQDSGATGEDSGWYPVQQQAWQGAQDAQRQQWQLNFTAKLLRLPGEAVTPGKIRATAYVLVKLP